MQFNVKMAVHAFSLLCDLFLLLSYTIEGLHMHDADRSLGRPAQRLGKTLEVHCDNLFATCYVVRPRLTHYFIVTKFLNVQILFSRTEHSFEIIAI